MPADHQEIDLWKLFHVPIVPVGHKLVQFTVGWHAGDIHAVILVTPVIFDPRRKKILCQSRRDPHQKFTDALVCENRPIRRKCLSGPLFSPGQRLPFADQVISTRQDGAVIAGKYLLQDMPKPNVGTYLVQKGCNAAAVSGTPRQFSFLFWSGILFIAATHAVRLHCPGLRVKVSDTFALWLGLFCFLIPKRNVFIHVCSTIFAFQIYQRCHADSPRHMYNH